MDTADNPLIVALDHASGEGALALCDRLDPGACRVKVASTLYAREGPAVVEALMRRGFEVFLDLKFHDIPAQVAGACRAACELGVWMLDVHAAGGPAMLAAAVEAVRAGAERPRLVAVTVLTSLGPGDLADVGLAGPPLAAVRRLARLAHAHGLDGIVCSPQELVALRTELPPPFVMVTPGIRPGGAGDDDQKRVMTPAAARAAGADYLVVGRPVTAAADPLRALEAIAGELTSPS